MFVSLIRRLTPGKRNMSGELFAEALKNENSGDFETAIINYEKALGEAAKTGFQSSNLKNKIIEKLKVLHTVIEYNNGVHHRR